MLVDLVSFRPGLQVRSIFAARRIQPPIALFVSVFGSDREATLQAISSGTFAVRSLHVHP